MIKTLDEAIDAAEEESVETGERSWRILRRMKEHADKETQTNTQFKVGDWVYISPGAYSSATHYIRARITDLDEDNNGYLLRAFEQDCPGLYMFNIWDRDLLPRTSRNKKALPENYEETIEWWRYA